MQTQRTVVLTHPPFDAVSMSESKLLSKMGLPKIHSCSRDERDRFILLPLQPRTISARNLPFVPRHVLDSSTNPTSRSPSLKHAPLCSSPVIPHIPDSWQYQPQNRHVCVLWREYFWQLSDVRIYCHKLSSDTYIYGNLAGRR
jgi:hypothetical protein